MFYFVFIETKSKTKYNLALDVVLNLSRDTPLKSLPKLFISALCSQLRKMASVMAQFSKVWFTGSANWNELSHVLLR